jgi:hypothetical protein
MNANSNVDVNPPNQAYVGPEYFAPMDGAPGNTTIHRKGIVTVIKLTGNLTASRILTFGTIAAEGWLPGDEVYIAVPTHTGTGFTLSVESINGDELATWAALLANGGHFVFGATSYNVPVGTGDFTAVNPGNSTT